MKTNPAKISKQKQLEIDSKRLAWLKRRIRERGIRLSLSGEDEGKWVVGPLHGA